MKCKKCGAGLPDGYLYCPSCGSEVQLVPDYNLLDEDILSDIIQREAGRAGGGDAYALERKEEPAAGGKAKKPSEKKKTPHARRVKAKAAAVLACLAVLAVFFAHQAIKKQRYDSFDYQYGKAEECFAAKEWEEAARFYERAVLLRPKDKKAGERLRDVYLALGDKEAAIALSEELVLKNPGDAGFLESLVALYDEAGDYDKILDLSKAAAGSKTGRIFAEYLAEPPKFGKRPGTYSEAIRVEISADRSCDIFYTEDGSDPVKNGAPYAGTVPLSKEGTTKLMAVARNQKGIYSEVAQATYTIQFLPPEMPKVSPCGGTYGEAQPILVQVPENCTAHYTWDGSDPTEASPVYSGPLEMQPGNLVLSVMLVSASGLKSGIYRVNYVYMP